MDHESCSTPEGKIRFNYTNAAEINRESITFLAPAALHKTSKQG